MRNKLVVVAALALSALPLAAQVTPAWSWRARAEVRADYRNSNHERFLLRFPFRPEMLPVGQTQGFLETPDPGSHVELNAANVQLDLTYGTWFLARAKVHATDLYRRNPTTSDRLVDADELFIRLGQKPEFLDRPERTSFFLQAGKFPKMERQPTRLLESYGLAATAFNRLEDVQVQVGGTVGRSLYWRLQVANGNPLFFRDPNALSGDNGTPELRQRNPQPDLNSGFPILYNAETEDLFIDNDHLQFGQGLGYRWQRSDGKLGFDAILFHYRRDMAASEELTGTFYGGDIDIIDEVLPTLPRTLPLRGDKKEEYGARVYGEWHNLTSTLQFTKQHIAGLNRQGYEAEVGYRFNVGFGPTFGGESLVQFIQPAARLSGITNRFRGSAALYPAPSIWWPWTKIDGGIRIGFAKGFDVTIEHAKHNIGAPVKLDLSETLVTLRWRVG